MRGGLGHVCPVCLCWDTVFLRQGEAGSGWNDRGGLDPSAWQALHGDFKGRHTNLDLVVCERPYRLVEERQFLGQGGQGKRGSRRTKVVQVGREHEKGAYALLANFTM